MICSLYFRQKMVIRTDEIIGIVTKLSDETGLKVTLNESVKGGLITGTICTIGGLILGPVGLALGGAIGGVLAYVKSDGKFKPASQVILYEMNAEDQRELVTSVKNILKELDATDVVQLMVLVNANPALKGRIIQQVVDFLQNQLRLSVM